MQTRLIALLLVSLCLLEIVASAAVAAEPQIGADAILGKWWFPKRDGQMEVRREDDTYFGKVVSYKDPDALDEHNPDPKLRERPFVGIEMLKDFKFDPKQRKWIDGTIYDGESGKTYKCTMWFENGDQDRLNVRGYIGFSFLGRTETFTRVTPEEEAQSQSDAVEQSKVKADGGSG